jgi:hypothetical protein
LLNTLDTFLFSLAYALLFGLMDFNWIFLCDSVLAVSVFLIDIEAECTPVTNGLTSIHSKSLLRRVTVGILVPA